MYLKQAVSNQGHQELMSVPLSHQRSVLRGIHGGKIKHCHIWLPIVINCKIQGRQLVVGCKVSSFSGIGQQIALVHIFPTEQQLSVNGVLQGQEDVGWQTPISNILAELERCSLTHLTTTRNKWHLSSPPKSQCTKTGTAPEKLFLPRLNEQLCLQGRIITPPSSLVMWCFQNIASLTSKDVTHITARLFCTHRKVCPTSETTGEQRHCCCEVWGSSQGLTSQEQLHIQTWIVAALLLLILGWVFFGQSGEGPCLFRSSCLKAVIINKAGSISSLIVDETPNHRWYHRTPISPVVPDTLGCFFFHSQLSRSGKQLWWAIAAAPLLWTSQGSPGAAPTYKRQPYCPKRIPPFLSPTLDTALP